MKGKGSQKIVLIILGILISTLCSAGFIEYYKREKVAGAQERWQKIQDLTGTNYTLGEVDTYVEEFVGYLDYHNLNFNDAGTSHEEFINQVNSLSKEFYLNRAKLYLKEFLKDPGLNDIGDIEENLYAAQEKWGNIFPSHDREQLKALHHLVAAEKMLNWIDKNVDNGIYPGKYSMAEEDPFHRVRRHVYQVDPRSNNYEFAERIAKIETRLASMERRDKLNYARYMWQVISNIIKDGECPGDTKPCTEDGQIAPSVWAHLENLLQKAQATPEDIGTTRTEIERLKKRRF